MFVFSWNCVQLLTCRSVQPVMFYHSSWGLGHSPNKHSDFVYTKTLLAEYTFEKSVIEFLKT